METRRYADSSSQVQELEETLSNLRLNSPSTYYPNPIYNPPPVEPIFNPAPLPGLATIHPHHWLQAAVPTYTPPPPPPPHPMWFTSSSLNPAMYLPQHNIRASDLIEFPSRLQEMMTHPTDNYLVQRLIEIADEDNMRSLLVSIIKTKFFLQRICCDTHGTRVVQKLVENLRERSHKNLLVLALRPEVLPLAFNDIGRHVIVQCLRNFSDAENEPILTEVARNVFAMGRHKSGYLVLTECVSCHHLGPNVVLVLDRVAENALLLSHDQYGNYVVQHALDQNIPRLTSNILARLEGNFASLSASKYGSNVVEKCLKCSITRDQCSSIIQELLHSPDISRLVVHSYGNYVIQTSLTLTKNLGLENQHRELLALLRMNMAELKISRHGKRLIKWLSSGR